MKKPAKKSSELKSTKKEGTPKIPKDVFEGESGTKMVIVESDNPKETLKETKEVEKKESTEDEISRAQTPQEDKDEIVEKSKESEQEDAKKDGEKSNEEERDLDLDSEEKASATEETRQETSFYEKVLGEKPPVDAQDSDDLEAEKEGIDKSLFFLGGVVFVLTIIIAAGVGFIFINSQNQQDIVGDEIVEAVPTEVPTPTAVEIDKASITFEVLNGSGQAGVAGRSGDAIEELGYSVSSVGNADSSDYSGVEVGFSGDITEDVKSVILKDLDDEFLGVEENEELLPEGTDVIVIIGS